MILGLDISTSITGYTILDDNKIVFCSKLDLRNKKYTDFFDKSVAARQLLNNIRKEYSIDKIFIEETLNVMNKGMSSAHTIMVLNRFNGILSWVCYEIFGIKPQYIACRQARKMVGINVPKGGDAKAITLQHWLDTDTDFKVEYTKFGNPQQGSYDMADSLTIAKAGYLLCQKTS